MLSFVVLHYTETHEQYTLFILSLKDFNMYLWAGIFWLDFEVYDAYVNFIT